MLYTSFSAKLCKTKYVVTQRRPSKAAKISNAIKTWGNESRPKTTLVHLKKTPEFVFLQISLFLRY